METTVIMSNENEVYYLVNSALIDNTRVCDDYHNSLMVGHTVAGDYSIYNTDCDATDPNSLLYNCLDAIAKRFGCDRSEVEIIVLDDVEEELEVVYYGDSDVDVDAIELFVRDYEADNAEYNTHTAIDYWDGSNKQTIGLEDDSAYSIVYDAELIAEIRYAVDNKELVSSSAHCDEYASGRYSITRTYYDDFYIYRIDTVD